MKYYINTHGDIVTVERDSLNYSRPVPPDQTVILSDIRLTNPSDWRWDGEGFVERDPVPYTLTNTEVLADESVDMTFPNHTIIDVFGPGISERFVTEELEFSSTRTGVYRFTVTNRPYKQTVFEVVVR